jgi:glycosyltransferase involved in cell wall biosynthesis
MRISVALATCNGDRYLWEQLYSFQTQTRLPDEVVISDDASQDTTPELLDRFAATAPFPVRIHGSRRRLGASGNFSKALSLTTGDVILLSDQDDSWFSHKVETIESTFTTHPTTHLIVNDALLTDRALAPTGLSRIDQITKARYPLSNFVQGACTSVTASLLRLALPIPVNARNHDAWLHAIARLLDVRLVLPEALQYFRRHDRNKSSSPTSTTSKMTLPRATGSRIRRNFINAPPRRRHISEELLQLETLWQWWERRWPPESATGPTAADGHANAALLDARIDVGLARLRLLQQRRLCRLLPALRLLASAGASTYGGRLVLAKDLLLK